MIEIRGVGKSTTPVLPEGQADSTAIIGEAISHRRLDILTSGIYYVCGELPWPVDVNPLFASAKESVRFDGCTFVWEKAVHPSLAELAAQIGAEAGNEIDHWEVNDDGPERG